MIITRRKEGKVLAGYWEFPGGKIEEEERNEDSLRRELKEELDMEVIVEDFLISVNHSYPTFSIELIAYSCNVYVKQYIKCCVL